MKRVILKESGIRDINEIARRYKQAKIYFHIDLDGVTSAIAMKVYLESYGIEVVDSETIQYGQDEFAIKGVDKELSKKIDIVLNQIRKILSEAGYDIDDMDEIDLYDSLKSYINQNKNDVNEKSKSLLDELKFLLDKRVMPVLVDFAHGKPMFKIHTDHHDSQSGVEGSTSTSFRHARSNVETISGVISTYDLFPPSDIKIISTVDSANFRAMNITVREVMNYIFKAEKESPERSNIIMGLVTNKILLAFKNKEFEGKNILERLVLICTPSLKNIYNNLIRMIMDSGLMDKVKGFLNTELGDGEPKGDKIRRIQQQLQKHGETYLEKVRGNIGKQLKYEDGIIIKDGSAGASMTNVGSYDRYVAFELIPDADFQVVTWGSVGLLQVSCNPYKESRGLKGVDLGKMNKEILENHKSELEGIKASIKDLKRVAESSKKFVPYESVGFTFQDFIALYSEKDENGKVIKDEDGKIVNIKGYFDVPEKFENFVNKKSKELGKKPIDYWQNLIRKTMTKPYVDLTEFEQSILKEVYVTAYDVIKNNSGGHKCITNFQVSALGGGFGPYKTTEYIDMIKKEFIEKLKSEIEKEKKEKIDENYFRNIIRKVLRG